jgi:UDPglucose 6-dehydrogenase
LPSGDKASIGVPVTVVGLGHVGLTTAVCLAHVGHSVCGVDEDREKLRLIGRGDVPFHEAGLPSLLRQSLASGRFCVTEDFAKAARHGEIVMICVGTPIRESGEANLTSVERATRNLAPHIDRYTVLTEKSTVPVGTGKRIRDMVEWTAPGASFDVASNPEFLREGQAVADTLRPTRIVVGAESDRAHVALRQLYQPIIAASGCPYVATDLATSELIKLASNAFLATKISFINAVADVCEAAGADVETVASAMGMDPRIGPEFLHAGIGYGGFCLPKDVAAFRYKAAELGVDLSLLAEVARLNDTRLERVIGKLRKVLLHLEGKRIAVWGLAFKNGTDDLREAPAIRLIGLLGESGASVVAYDPVAREQMSREMPDVAVARDLYEAAEGADAVIICTEWPEFADVDLTRLRRLMTQPIIIDGRNMLNPQSVEEAGFVYASMGRLTLQPSRQRPEDDQGAD